MRLATETEVRQEVVTLLPGDVLGTAELARELGIRPRTLSAYLARGQVPAPALQLACGPLWTRGQVTELLERYEARAERAEKRLRAAEKVWTSAVEETARAIGPDLRERRVMQAELNTRRQRAKRNNPGTVLDRLRLEAADVLEADAELTAARDEAERLRDEAERRQANELRGTWADDEMPTPSPWVALRGS